MGEIGLIRTERWPTYAWVLKADGSYGYAQHSIFRLTHPIWRGVGGSELGDSCLDLEEASTT
jgi:hypothetical protein